MWLRLAALCNAADFKFGLGLILLPIFFALFVPFCGYSGLILARVETHAYRSLPNREDQGRIVPVPLVTKAECQRFRRAGFVELV